MHARSLLPSPVAVASWLVLAVAMPLGEVVAQWNIGMRVMRNPLPLGQCTFVEIVVEDAQGRQGPPRPDGKQVSGWDFDFSIVSSSPDAFRLQNDDPTRPFICARASTAASATFVAHYPGRHLTPGQTVPGVELRQSVEVAMEGMPSNPGFAGGNAPGDGSQSPGAAAGGYTQPPSGGSPPPTTYPQPPAYPQPAYPQPAGYPQGDPTQQAAPTVGAASPAAPPAGVRTGKQFLDRITGHAKHKAAEVASNTTTDVADAAGDVVGTTLETGGDVVKSGAGTVTGAASAGVQGVGRSLGAAPTPRDPADVAAALSAGRAVLYGLRFTNGTSMLEPSSGPLISQIAGALARTPGQFLIEAHVDGKQDAAAQALSEQRAAAIKAALVAAGSSPMQLAAVGYGATRPVADAKSSARIEIARTQ